MFNYYLESEFIDDVLARCDSVNSDKYYILMAQELWDTLQQHMQSKRKTHKYFPNNNLNDATFNKAIQKCIESRRVTDDDKSFKNS